MTTNQYGTVSSRRTKRRLFAEDQEGDAGYQDGQYRKFKFSYGRNLTNRQLLGVLQRKAVGYTIERFGGVNRYQPGVNGYYVLDHRESSVTIGPPSEKVYDVPFYIFEITQRAPDTSSQIIAATKLGYRMQTYNKLDLVTPSNSMTDVRFSGLTGHGYLADNSAPLVTTDYAQVMVNNNANVAPTVNDATYGRLAHGVLEWSKIKLLLRAPTSRAGKFIVKVIRFRDPLLTPSNTVSIDRDAYYERECSNAMFNPIKTQEYGASRKAGEYVTVVKQFVKEFSPNTNAGFINDQIHGQAFELDWFMRLNKFCNFAQRIGPDYAGGQEYLNEDSLLMDTGLHRVFNHPHQVNERLFLTVQMTYFDAPHSLNAPFDGVVDGSFDIEVHNKYIWKADTGQ